MPERISERELILPSLYLMTLRGGSIETSDLIPELRQVMNPPAEDLTILRQRSDDKFSQKVRNLASHRTFDKLGYAVFKDGSFAISDEGRGHLQRNQDILTYLLANDFSYADLTRNLKLVEAESGGSRIQTFDENIIVREGIKSLTQRDIYDRSKMLRDYALNYYSSAGEISCRCCGFNFNDFYGNDVGGDFIEMHHIRPIFKYTHEDIVKTLETAVNNLCPLCSNCHRMIHRKPGRPLEVEELINIVSQNGIFRNSM